LEHLPPSPGELRTDHLAGIRQIAPSSSPTGRPGMGAEYLTGAGLANDPMAMLFQTYSRATGQLTGHPLPQRTLM